MYKQNKQQPKIFCRHAQLTESLLFKTKFPNIPEASG